MQNNEIQTNEADIQNNDINLEQEMKELNSVEQSSNTAVPTDEYNKKGINPIFTEEVIPYYDPNVLLTNSQELKTVDDYYRSVTCERKDIENLLYEVQGYSLAETAKLNKLIILKGEGRNGKSKIFRVLEAILGDKCSHEHLEQLSRKQSRKQVYG